MTRTSVERRELSGAVVSMMALEGMAVSVRRYRRGSALAWHDHDLASLSVVLAGAYVEALPARDRECSTGMAVLHPSGERHRDVHGSADVRMLNIALAPGRGTEARPLGTLLAESTELASPEILALGRRLARAIGGTGPAATILAEGLALEMLGIAVGQDRRREPEAPAWLTRVVDRILAEPAAEHRVGDLAALAGVHPVHLARTFRREHRTTIGDFIRDARVGWAREQLARDVPLAEIAQLAGFSDQSHFSRVFSRLVGVPPGRYRQSIRGGRDDA